MLYNNIIKNMSINHISSNLNLSKFQVNNISFKGENEASKVIMMSLYYNITGFTVLKITSDITFTGNTRFVSTTLTDDNQKRLIIPRENTLCLIKCNIDAIEQIAYVEFLATGNEILFKKIDGSPFTTLILRQGTQISYLK